jgi:hypothetical protein
MSASKSVAARLGSIVIGSMTHARLAETALVI